MSMPGVVDLLLGAVKAHVESMRLCGVRFTPAKARKIMDHIETVREGCDANQLRLLEGIRQGVHELLDGETVGAN